MPAMITFITGGVKTGKSTYALNLARKRFKTKTFVATALAEDEEMRERIRKHRAERDETFTTVEEPLDISRVRATNIILDDITLWMGNLLYHSREEEWKEILTRFFEENDTDMIIVSNETGWGNIPMEELTRKYNRLLGAANAFVAARADEVFLMVAGIPLEVKPGPGKDEEAVFK